MKSGFVSIVGRPNVGKSTLLNTLLERKLAITSNVSGTTRNIIQGIYNDDDSQIIFIDTPGIHKPKTKLGNTMVETSIGSINDVDIIVFVVEAISNKINDEEIKILDTIKKLKKKTILVVNKMDLANLE